MCWCVCIEKIVGYQLQALIALARALIANERFRRHVVERPCCEKKILKKSEPMVVYLLYKVTVYGTLRVVERSYWKKKF